MFNHFDLPTVFPIGLCVVLVFIGLHEVNKRLRHLKEKRARVEEFLKNLKLFVESGAKDRQAYFRMVHQSALVQRDIGSYGLMSYRPPYANHMFHNCQMVVNLLSEIDRWIQDDDMFLSLKPGRALVQTLQESLVRFLGVIDDIQPGVEKIRRNPLLLLREGISWLLALPIAVFSFLGMIGENISEVVAQSGFVRFASGLITLIGLLGSIVTLVVGWSQFIDIVSKWL